jgi:hypothetical protein
MGGVLDHQDQLGAGQADPLQCGAAVGAEDFVGIDVGVVEEG